MNLMGLTKSELLELRIALTAAWSAADALEDGGFAVSIDITDAAVVLRAGPILGARSGAGAPVEIEEHGLVKPCGIEAAAVSSPEIAPVSSVSGVSCDDAPVFAPDPAVAEVDPAPSLDADPLPPSRFGPVVARVVGEDGLLRGSWTAAEDDRLVVMRNAGATWGDVAAALNRPVAATTFRGRKILRDRIEVAPVPEALARAKQDDRAGDAPAETTATPAAPQSVPGDAGSAVEAGPETAGPACQAEDGTDGQRKPDPAAPPPASSSSSPPAAADGAGDLTGDARRLWVVIAQLRADPRFDADLDFDLCDGLAHGRKLAELALEFDMDAAVLKSRFALLTASIRNEKGQITLGGKEALLQVMRRRMAQARGIAA